MKKMKRKMLMGSFLGFLVFGSPVLADLIDFRDVAWSSAHRQQSLTVGSVTVTCNPTGNPLNDDVLYWDPVDGFGVTSPGDPTVPSPTEEADEIDSYSEYLHVRFDSPTLVYGVRVADLYGYLPPEPRSPEWVEDPSLGGDGVPYTYGEYGFVGTQITTGPGEGFYFRGQDSGQANGEQYVPVDRVVSLLYFEVMCERNSDYSVIGIDVVPVPAAFLLGVLGLGCAGWRLRRRAI